MTDTTSPEQLALAALLIQIDALLTAQEKAVKAAFVDFVRSVGSDAAIASIMERITANDTAGAMTIVDSYVARMGNVLPRVYTAVGEATVPEMAAIAADAGPVVPRLVAPEVVAPTLTGGGSGSIRPPTIATTPAEPIIAISFDPTNPRAAELIREHRVQFVTNFSEQQRNATTQALSRSLMRGEHSTATARAIRDSIGLTTEQEQWVSSYRTALETRSRNALGRALRDKRTDAKVENAIRLDRPLTEKQIDSMVDRYRKNALALRAETISLTEAQTATSAARDESFRQMLEQTGLSADDFERVWHSTRDKRTRDSHRSMQDQRRSVDEPFVSGFGNRILRPGDPDAVASERIRCRCTVTNQVKA